MQSTKVYQAGCRYGQLVCSFDWEGAIPSNDGQPGLPRPRVDVLNAADLPENPGPNHSGPEELHKDRGDPI